MARMPAASPRRAAWSAAVVPIDAEDCFRMRLASDSRFIEIVERSRASYEATGGVSLAEMRRRYGVPAKGRRRT
jgi:hypothetical protein